MEKVDGEKYEEPKKKKNVVRMREKARNLLNRINKMDFVSK